MATVSGTPPTIFDLEINLSSLSSGTLNTFSSYINRTSPIVFNPSDYYVSVSRFICSTQQIPLWSSILNTTAPYNDGYNTIYSVSLTYGIYASSQVYLRVINASAPVAPPPVPVLQQPTNGWGYVRSYYTICEMLNIALATAYGQLLTAVGGSATLDPNPPYFTWDNQTQIFTINCFPMSQYDKSSGDDVVNIIFNNNYRQYLLGWDYIALSDISTPNGLDIILNIRNTGNNYSPASVPPTYLPDDPTATLLQFQQSIQAPWAFSALSRIQITTSLPLAFPTLGALPLEVVGTSANNATNPVLCDFLVDYSSGGAGSFNQPVLYFPALDSYSSPVKLSGSSILTEFNIGVSWLTASGQIIPLAAYGTVNSSIKLTFTHKSLIENGF